MTSISVQLPADLKRQLDELSERLHRAPNELISESIRRYIAAERLKTMRNIAVPLAEAKGYLTDEDVFRDFS